MRRVYVRSLGIALLLLITLCVWGTIAEAGELKPGTPNTITLPNGDVVYNLNGEWNGTTYSSLFGTSKYIGKITQKDDRFFGVPLTDTGGGSDFSKGIRGILKKDGFKKVVIIHPFHGLLESSGKIIENGNKIKITHYTAYEITITLKRK